METGTEKSQLARPSTWTSHRAGSLRRGRSFPGATTHGRPGLARDNFLSLPAWFPAEKASAILRATGKRFLLVSDGKGVAGVADLRHLAAAPATKSVSWCVVPLGPAVTPATALEEVRLLMDAHRSAYLPVVVGGVIVGIVASDATASRSMAKAADRVAA